MFTQVSEWVQESPRFELSLLMTPRLVDNKQGGQAWEHSYTLKIRDDGVSAKPRYTEIPVDSTAVELALAQGDKPLIAALCALSEKEEEEFFTFAPTFKAHYEALALQQATQPATPKQAQTLRGARRL